MFGDDVRVTQCVPRLTSVAIRAVRLKWTPRLPLGFPALTSLCENSILRYSVGQ